MREIIIIIIFFISLGFSARSGEKSSATPVFGVNMPDLQKEKGKKGKNKEEIIKPAPAALLIEAKKEAIVGNIKGASEKFQNLTDRYPDDPVAFYELARIQGNQNNLDDAIANAKKAISLSPGNIWYSLFLAEVYYNAARFREAIELYEKIVEISPNNADYQYQLAALYMQVEKFPEAIKMYDRIEENAGVSEEIILQKEKIYLHLNDLKNAEKEIRKLISAFPGESHNYSILAEFYLANNMNEKALETYKKVAEMDPDNAYIHMSMADYYRKTGDNQKAYEELKLGFATPNLDVDTKVNILLSFYTVNQIYNDLKDQAFTLSKILIATHPKDPKVFSIYGDFLAQDKQFSEARNAFLKVLTLDSSRYVVWEQILQIDLQLSEYDHLLIYGKKAMELFPEQPLPFLYSGLANMQLKKYPEALKVLKTGENLVVDNSDLQAQFCMYEGDALHAQKKDDEAFQAYEKSLALKYDNAYVLNNYAYYLSLDGKNLEKAEKMSKKSVALEPENASFQDTYGWVLFKQGNYQDAATWILKAINNKEAPSGEVLEHYGDVLFKLNDPAMALEYWNKAQQKGGGSERLHKKIAEKKYYP
ncbi:MAG: tetratricopeptide repeat protein [Bacteroidota bacterium]